MSKIDDLLADGFYVPSGKNAPTLAAQGIISGGVLEKDLGVSDFVFQGVSYGTAWNSRSLDLRASPTDDSRITVNLAQRHTESGIWRANGTRATAPRLSQENNPPNGFVLVGIKLDGNTLEFWHGETLDTYRLHNSFDLATLHADSVESLNNTLVRVTTTGDKGFYSFGFFDVNADISSLLVDYPTEHTTLLASAVKPAKQLFRNTQRSAAIETDNAMPWEYSFVETGYVKNLPSESGAYVFALNGKEYPVTVESGVAKLRVEEPPFYAGLGTLLTPDRSKAATILVETMPLAYGNFPSYCLGLYDVELAPVSMNGEAFTYAPTTTPQFLESGARIGIRNGRLAFDPMNAYEHLEGDDLAVESFTLGFDDGTTKDVRVYILPSREVGENLVGFQGTTGTIPTEIGCVYEVRAEVSGVTTGSIIPNTVSDLTQALTVNGIGYWLFRAGSLTTQIAMDKRDGFDGQVDGLSVRKILEDGDAADIKFIETEGNSLRFSCYPAGGLLDETDYTDVKVSKIMAVDDTFVIDDFGHKVVPMRDSQYIKFNNFNTVPADSAFEIEIECSFEANYEIQYQQDNTLFASDSLQDEANTVRYPSFRMEAFDGYAALNIPIIGQSSVNVYWPSRYIDYTKMNNFKVGRDVGGNFYFKVNDVVMPYSFGRSAQTYTGELKFDTLGYRWGQNLSRRSINNIYKKFKLTVDGVLQTSLDLLSADGNSLTITDTQGQNDASYEGTQLINSTVAYYDNLSKNNTAIYDAASIGKLGGVAYRHENENAIATGWLQCENLYIVGGVPIETEKYQSGVSVGLNSAPPRLTMVNDCQIDLKLESNRGLHASLGNSDHVIQNANFGANGIYPQMGVNNLKALNGNDGCVDSKASLFLGNSYLHGADMGIRAHVNGGIYVVQNTEFARGLDSSSMCQLIGPNVMMGVYNTTLDGERVVDHEQAEAIRHKSAVEGDHVYTQPSITVANIDPVEWLPEEQDAAHKAFKVYKTKPHTPARFRYNFTDFDVEYRGSESVGAWTGLPEPLNGHGVFQRSLGMPSGTYDFRVRAKYGSKVGPWFEAQGVDIVNA